MALFFNTILLSFLNREVFFKIINSDVAYSSSNSRAI